LKWPLLFLLVALPAFAQKIEADVQCRPSGGENLIYHCTIRLTRGGAPLSGAQVTVGADMPSMPMAHNIRPVKARPGKNPGEYHASLELEMQGEWAVKLRIAGPVRDQIDKKITFD
jgi:hypothetical protein